MVGLGARGGVDRLSVDWERNRLRLELKFPGLKQDDGFEIKSPAVAQYNCIAFAAGDESRPWWPVPYANEPPYYWPEPANDETLADFKHGFACLGYAVCDQGELEAGYEKVAIYMRDGEVTHMARQDEWGHWLSKCGNLHDIRHVSLEALCGDAGNQYGQVVCLMKRRRQPS